VNAHDRWLKRTPLHYAADEGHARFVELLLDYGADVSLADANERTAFHIAAMRADEATMKLLIASVKEGDRLKALINAPDKFSLTPAFLAHQARGADHGAFILLLTNGAHWDD
jgi:ankyrin repeat protein